MNTFETANRLQPESLHLSYQNPGEVGTALLMPQDIKNVSLLGSTKSVTKCVHISSILRLKVKAFGHGSSLEMEHRLITLNCRVKDCNWNGIIQIICCIRSLRLTLQWGKFMSTIFWDAEVWSNHELRPKPCRSISGEFSLTDLLL
jgi:hypothetical protein